ncbi:hypothetical protein ACA910_001108 [Epithemia clementina (nom. ined.)]
MSLLGGNGALTGDIWSTGAFSFESPLKDLLDSKDYTLEQLLAEDELLQELRGLHPILTEYFASERALTKLVRYIILPPAATTVADEGNGSSADKTEGDSVTVGENGINSHVVKTTAAQRLNRQLEKRKTGENKKSPESDPEFRRIRFPYMACEIICCEIDGIINTFVDGYAKEEDDVEPTTEDENQNQSQAEVSPAGRVRLLDVFFGVLYDTPPGQLDDYRAGYFEKILSLLFRKRGVEMSKYINSGGAHGQQSLMEAMMKHLYSNSIMQILQRLLLPPRPTPRQEAGSGEEQPGIDSQSAINNNSETATSMASTPKGEDAEMDDEAAVVGGGQDILSGEEDDGETGFKCDWPKSPGLAINMLLQRLIDPDPLLEEKEGHSIILRPLSAVETDQSIEEQRLNMSLNASEVLITVIQNSLLSSETMLYLTSLEPMQRLVKAATTLRENDGAFPPHESLLTSAMNVVESLVLQLGGYGAVGTMAVLEQPPESAGDQEVDAATPGSSTDPEPLQETGDAVATENATPAASDTTAVAFVPQNNANNPLIADLTSLLEVLPDLLQGFAKLLRHPATKEWTSPLQFSQTRPVQLLGTPRLRIVRVLESLVLLGDPAVDSKLVQSDCLSICLDLFWEFQWCSMLHQSVANLLVHVFEGQNARLEIQDFFISKSNLIGRLLDSFGEGVFNQSDGPNGPDMDFDEAPDGSTSATTPSADVLPVSEDDIDAVMEKQEDEEKATREEGDEEGRKGRAGSTDADSTEAVMNRETRNVSSGTMVSSPAQSFRYGYMGHVVIISQALVQACAGSQWAAEQAKAQQQQAQDNGVNGSEQVASVPGAEEMVQNEPVIIADLVNNHELAERWQNFVVTTLATEITVQSTALGGIAPQHVDSLQHASRPDTAGGRRPGLADDGDIGDGDGATAPLPPRGMITASEINDIDDRDLEVAASMMAGLNFGRPSPDDAESVNSGDSERSYNSGETAHTAGYLFDDPLGKAGSSLGIELGKLTQYRPGGKQVASAQKRNTHDSDDDDDDDGEDDDNSSSDEEAQGGNNDNDVPVMDLFAGNFNYGQGENNEGENNEAASGEDDSDEEDKPNDDVAAFDFANFDNAAFDGAAGTDDTFGEFTSAFPASTPVAEAESNPAADAEDIFGSGSNSSLLDDLEEIVTEAQPPFGSSTEKKSGEEEEQKEAQSPQTDAVATSDEAQTTVEAEPPSSKEKDEEAVAPPSDPTPPESDAQTSVTEPASQAQNENDGAQETQQQAPAVDEQEGGSEATTKSTDAETTSAAEKTEAELATSTSETPDKESGDSPQKEGVLVS